MTKKQIKKKTFVYGKTKPIRINFPAPTPIAAVQTKRKRGRPKKIVGPLVTKQKRGRPKKQPDQPDPSFFYPRSYQEKMKYLKEKMNDFKTVIIDTPKEALDSLKRNSTEAIYLHAPILPPETHFLANGAIDPFPEIMEVTQEGIDPIAIVHWKTAGKSSGLKKMITVGFIIRKDTERITIAQTTSDNYTNKGIFNIPMSLVTKIEKLTEQKKHNILW